MSEDETKTLLESIRRELHAIGWIPGIGLALAVLTTIVKIISVLPA